MLWFYLLLSLLVVLGDRVYFLQLICRRIQYVALVHCLIRLNPFIYILFVQFLHGIRAPEITIVEKKLSLSQ